MKNIISLIIISAFSLTSLKAQEAPAPPQKEAIALVGATAHLGNGEVIENAAIGFADGKITYVGSADKLSSDFKTIDVQGKDVYPGLIAANTAIGLAEIGAVRATRDYYEVGSINPNVRSQIAFNTDSRVIPTIRSNGVLLVESAPQGGRVPGTSSLMHLDGWNYEDATYKVDIGIHLNWPSMSWRKGWWAEPGGIEMNKEYLKQIDEIEALFAEAKGYQQAPSKSNLKLEAMKGLFDNSQKLFVHVGGAKETIDAIKFAQKYGLKMVVVGGRDAWMITDLLKENDIAVILNRVHNLPAHSDDDTDQAFKTPLLLKEAGIKYCITVGSGWDGFWDQRNLPFHAGTAVTYGLTKEEALMAITSNAADILGVGDQTGTLEVGKDANIIVSKGDLLDMRTNHIDYAFIQGRQVDLDNKQKALYRKFMNKYGLEIKQH